MKHLVRSLFIVLALSTPSWAQLAIVSADLRTAFGEFQPSRAKVTFRLQNYGSSIPRITSGPLAGVLVQPTKTVLPNTVGQISTNVYRNDFIDPPDTWWSVEYTYNGEITSSQSYLFLANTVNLDAAAPISSYPVPPLPTPPSAVLTNPPGGAQQNVSGPLSMTSLIVNPGVSSVMGNSASPSTGVVLRVDNTFTNPDLLSPLESRGVSVVNRRTQTNYPEGSADQFGVLGAVTIEAGTTAGTINGQMKAVPSEIYLQHPTVGAYTVVTALNYFASVPALETGATLTNWYGLRVNDPCRVGGGGCTGTFAGGGTITNGYAIYIEGVTSPPVTNRAAIKIPATGQDGAIEWTVEHLRELADGQAVKEIVTNGPFQVGEVAGTVAQLRLPTQTTVDGTHPTLDAGVGALQAKTANGHLYWCLAGTCTDLTPSAPGAGAFVNNGNAFAAAAVLGTTDNNYLSFISNSVEFGRVIQNAGNPFLLAGLTATDLVVGRGALISGNAICSATAASNASVGCLSASGGVINLSSNKSGAGTIEDLVIGTPTERMRITASGVVGIGTGASPSRALHVKDAAAGVQLRLQGPAPGGAGSGIELAESGTVQAFFTAGSAAGARITTSVGIPLTLGAALNDAFKISSSGAAHVAIGDTASLGYVLSVKGIGTVETCGGGCSFHNQLLLADSDNAGAGVSFYPAGVLGASINSTVGLSLVIANEAANAAVVLHHIVGEVSIAGILQLTKDGAAFYTFATLPAVIQGGLIYCSDCKSVVTDGAAAGSIAAGAGTGAFLGALTGANWRTIF